MGTTTLVRGCPAETQYTDMIGIAVNVVSVFCLEKRTSNGMYISSRTEKRGSLSMDEDEKVCGRCKFNIFDHECSEFVCDNPESDAYGVGTAYCDSCTEWENRE